jgi:hypothetical protein
VGVTAMVAMTEGGTRLSWQSFMIHVWPSLLQAHVMPKFVAHAPIVFICIVKHERNRSRALEHLQQMRYFSARYFTFTTLFLDLLRALTLLASPVAVSFGPAKECSIRRFIL